MGSAEHRRFKDDIYEQVARLGKAASAPKRLELLDLLCQGPRTVEALAEHAGLSIANASQHLQVLRQARLVETTKRGLYVEYRLSSDEVNEFVVSLRRLAEARLAEVEQVTRAYLKRRDEMEAVDGRELRRRAKTGDVVVLDVRPAEEYRAGHIAGALSIPIGELKARMKELPKSRDVVAYCRGPYCVYADQAVELLAKHGRRALRLREGFPEWKAAGRPIATALEGGVS